MAPKFPNPNPPTDSVRGRLQQFIEVAGRAVYPPLAVAPSPTTAGQIWWDISDTIKIRNEGNTDWASLATTMGAVSFGDAQALTSGEKTQALTNIGAQPAGSYQPAGGYVRYDDAQSLSDAQKLQARSNTGSSDFGVGFANVDAKSGRTWSVNYTNSTGKVMFVSVVADVNSGARGLTLTVGSQDVSKVEFQGQTQFMILNVSGFVPPGSTYRVEVRGAVTSAAREWVEFKLP